MGLGFIYVLSFVTEGYLYGGNFIMSISEYDEIYTHRIVCYFINHLNMSNKKMSNKNMLDKNMFDRYV